MHGANFDMTSARKSGSDTMFNTVKPFSIPLRVLLVCISPCSFGLASWTGSPEVDRIYGLAGVREMALQTDLTPARGKVNWFPDLKTNPVTAERIYQEFRPFFAHICQPLPVRSSDVSREVQLGAQKSKL